MGHPFTGTIYFALRVASAGGREAGHSSATFFIIKVFAGAGCRLICWAGLGWAGLGWCELGTSARYLQQQLHYLKYLEWNIC